MRKIFIVLAFILLVCTGCGAEPAQNSADVTISPSPGEINAPEPTPNFTPKPTVTVKATPEPIPSATVTLEPTAIPIVKDYILNSDSVVLRSGLKISDLESYFDFTRGELVQKLGDEFEIVDSGVEGLLDGYHYRELGFTLVFDTYNDAALLFWIECDVDKLELNGLKQDMSLYQIQKRLGKGNLKRDTVQDGIDEYGYYLTYKIDKIILEFFSFAKDGRDSDGYSASIYYNYDL